MRERRQSGAAEAAARERRDMLVVAFANQKGGVGKTTLIINLAIAALRRGIATSVLDIDPQKSAERFAELRGETTGEETPVVVHGTADSLKAMIEVALGGGIELLLLDCPGALDRTMLMAAALADRVIVPTRSSVLDRNALGDTLEYLAMAEKAGKCCVVLNCALDGTDGGTGEVRTLAARFGVPVAATQIEDLRIFSVALAKGRAVAETGGKGGAKARAAAQSIEALLDEIIGKTDRARSPARRQK